MRRITLTLLIMTLALVLTACGKTEQSSEVETTSQQFVQDESLSPGEQLKERLLFLGDDATISSEDDKEALWDFLSNNRSEGNEELRWKLTDRCYLTIIGGRNIIQLVDDGLTSYYYFDTTIDCPTDVTMDEVSFISPRGTYTSDNSKRWTFGRETEVTEAW